MKLPREGPLSLDDILRPVHRALGEGQDPEDDQAGTSAGASSRLSLVPAPAPLPDPVEYCSDDEFNFQGLEEESRCVSPAGMSSRGLSPVFASSGEEDEEEE